MLPKRTNFRPFDYPQLYDLFVKHERIHWTPSEIVTEFAEDTKDFNYRMSEPEKRFLIELMKFFTQADIDVMDTYIELSKAFKSCPEAAMLLSSVAAREAVHVDAYSTINTAISLPDSCYSEFLRHKAMRDKHDYVSTFDLTTPSGMARALALVGLFTEGLQLYSSFAMLMNFSRFGKMKGMTKVVTWSIRDEQIHVDTCVALYKIITELYKSEISLFDLQYEVLHTCHRMVELEDDFIDLAFNAANHDIPGMTAAEVKQFIRWLANDRVARIGITETPFPGAKNPFPWIIDVMYAKEHQNFFEGKGTEYTMGGVVGDELF